MEDLSKQQMILLTLLLSFVTSIATGIITVSLLNEAPQEITQTINRVVEKTIERVVPVEVPGKANATKEVKEITVIVKEEELVIDSIEKNNRNLVRIERIGAEVPHVFLGLVLSSNGLVVFPSRDVWEGVTYRGSFFDGATSTLKILSSDTKNGLTYAQATPNTIDLKKSYVFYPVVIAKTEPKLGQSVIVLGGEETTTVATGRVSTFGFVEEAIFEGEKETKTKVLVSIKTDISSRNEIIGSPLLSLSGEVFGIKTTLAEGTYLPISRVQLSISTSTSAVK
ncbi:MAG: hypothetical protein AAB944_02790 [Patescibacteria group bacterium]